MCAKLLCAHNNLAMQNTEDKADIQKMKVNATKIQKVSVDKSKLHIAKEWRPWA